jgi:hypothetical protein
MSRSVITWFAFAVASACASSEPQLHAQEPTEPNPCGGVGELTRLEVSIDRAPKAADPGATGADAARADASREATLELFSCCRGLLLIDGEARAALHEGPNAALAISEGKRRLSLEIEGRRLHEEIILVAAGDRVRVIVR